MGDLPLTDALRIAYEQKKDLVEISPNANPPIAKIIDYGKFKYTQAKKEREHHKKQKETEIKSVRISLGIGQHDKDIKANMAKEFLGEGDKVSVEMVLRGREKANKDFARKKFNEFLAILGDEIVIETPIRPGPRGMSAIISTKQATNKKQ